jgi:hypothetical protein
MRSSPAIRIAAALSGALTIVVAIALGAGHASSSHASAATVRLVSVAHALVEKASSAGVDRIEAAPAQVSNAAQPSSAADAPALPWLPDLHAVAEAGESGSLELPSPVASHARTTSRVHAARGPPRAC